jgi:hypothetical protein
MPKTKPYTNQKNKDQLAIEILEMEEMVLDKVRQLRQRVTERVLLETDREDERYRQC